MQPPLQVFGQECIPSEAPCLFTINHYSRPGFHAWWLTLSVSACVPFETHWVITSAWTFSERWPARALTPFTRWVFRQVAQVYGFTNMPPMPPRPGEAAARAEAVRRVLAYAQSSTRPAIGLAPEGRDTPGGILQSPPLGAGRFILQLSRLGLEVVPVGIYEVGGNLCVNFGPPYCLQAPAGLSALERDLFASRLVMTRIAAQLPAELRGEYG